MGVIKVIAMEPSSIVLRPEEATYMDLNFETSSKKIISNGAQTFTKQQHVDILVSSSLMCLFYYYWSFVFA